jgi:uncharacterized coiled-coil DUF342 family protein
MNISNALFSKYKGCEWSMNNEDYSTLEWFSDNIPKPTEEELIEECERLQEEYAATEYQRQRAPEYPDIKDQLDAIWKGGDAYEEMLARVMEVKTKYPKPE